MSEQKNHKHKCLLSAGDKQQHRQDLIPLIVTEVMRNDKGELSPLAMLKLIQAKVNQSIRRFEHEFGERN